MSVMFIILACAVLAITLVSVYSIGCMAGEAASRDVVFKACMREGAKASAAIRSGDKDTPHYARFGALADVHQELCSL